MPQKKDESKAIVPYLKRNHQSTSGPSTDPTSSSVKPRFDKHGKGRVDATNKDYIDISDPMDGIRIRSIDSDSQSSTGKVPKSPGPNRSSTTTSTLSTGYLSSGSDRRRPLGLTLSGRNHNSRRMRIRSEPSHLRLRSRGTPYDRKDPYDSGRRSQDSGARFVQYREDLRDKPPPRDETQAQADGTQQASSIPSVLAEPFFAWLLRHDEQTKSQNCSGKNMILIMSRLHNSLSTGSMSKFYGKTYECTRKELWLRHSESLPAYTEHSSKAVGTVSLRSAPQKKTIDPSTPKETKEPVKMDKPPSQGPLIQRTSSEYRNNNISAHSTVTLGPKDIMGDATRPQSPSRKDHLDSNENAEDPGEIPSMETQMPEEAIKNARASQRLHRLDTMDHYRKLTRGLIDITEELLYHSAD